MQVETEASLRAELGDRIAQAQDDINANMSSIRQAAMAGSDSSNLAAAELQLQSLSGLQHRIGRADGAALRSISGEVAAIAVAAQFIAQQARAASGQSADATLQQARAAARQTVSAFVDDYYGKKIFDPYLRFNSPEDEQAFRDREESRRRAIEAARAEGTPQGDLRAVKLSRDQMVDAGTYGAKDSPDYQPQMDKLKNAIDPLEQALAVGPDGRDQAAADAALAPSETAETALVPADILATLKSTGAVLADNGQTGHGVSLDATRTVSTVQV